MPFLTMHSLTRVPFMRYDGIKFGVLIQPPRGCGWREAAVSYTHLTLPTTILDHRIISVAQLSEGLAPRGDFRLAHTGLEIKSAGGRVSASVTLARGCDTYTGHGESANTPFARRRCVSEAALAAVNRAAGETCFELASVDAVTLAGQGIVVAQVYSLRDGQRLLGSAFLNEDPDNAAVHSVLCAVNRRLSVLPRTAG